MARRRLKEEDANNVDLTSVYAYADSSHFRDRELWRGFLSCVLPLILPHSSETIDQIILDSLVESVEDLVIKGDFSESQTHAIRSISTHIAKAIGVSPEFALASFYNSEYGDDMPTKLYKLHYKPIKKQTLIIQEENMISDWLANFNAVCTDKKFLDFVETWKGRFD